MFCIQVRAELKKRWQEYACAQRVDVRGCFRGMHPKYLWQCSRRPAASSSQSCADHHHHSHSHSNSDPCPYQDGGGAQTHTHLLQVPTQGGRGVGSQPQWAGRATALEFYPRKSLSSSDGEMTMGETMEEILEESEF